MDYDSILQKVIQLAKDQFGEDQLGEESRAADVATWNSLSHVMLVGAIEKTFGIKFDLMQMLEMKTIGDLARASHEAIK